MSDLGNRTNVNTAINLLLDDAQPNEAIQPSDHNTLLQNILDTLANGLSVTLRTNPETGGQDIEITSGDKLKYKSSTFFNSLVSATLTADRTLTFPDKTDTIATLTDIENIMNTNGLILGGNYTHDLNSNNLVFDDGSFRLTNGSLGVLGSFNATHDGATGQDVATFISSSANSIMVLSNTYEAVAIGTTGPSISAILDIESTTKGVLFPRMTTTQRNAISTPVESMFIYNTTDNQFEFRSSGGTWDALSGGGASIYSADGTLSGNRTVSVDTNTITFSTANGTLKLSDFSGSVQGVSQTLQCATGSNKSVGFSMNVGVYSSGIAMYGSTARTDLANKTFLSGGYAHGPLVLKNDGPNNSGEMWFNISNGTTDDGTISKRRAKITKDDFKIHNVTGLIYHPTDDEPTKIGTENVSLQGHTIIKGLGTTTGTTLALFDGQGTPAKLWDFLDNGDVIGEVFSYTNNALNIFNNLSGDANGNESLTIEGQHLSAVVGSGARIGFKQTNSSTYAAYIKSYTFGAANTGLGFATGFGSNPTVKMTIDGNGKVNMSSLPTSSTGLISGDIYNDGGTLKIV